MFRTRLEALASTMVLVLVALPATAGTTLIDDFEAADAASAWSFSNGAEFPGATGAMSLVAANGGHAISIDYDFSGGGAYVAVTHDLNPAFEPVALRFKALAPAGARLGVNVRDASGQWLQYSVQRPLAPLDEGAWFTTVLELGSTESHFSGANDGIVHPPIDSVSFTVSVEGSERAGTVLLDDIEHLDSLEFAVDPSTVSLAPAAAGVASLMDGLGVAIHSTSDAVALDAAQSAGLTWVRTDLFWSSVETTPGVYDFSSWDGLLDLLDARGMKALFILDYGNDLYGGGPPTSTEATAAFVAYARAAAEHFAGRGARFEVWNEPDNAFWTPTDPLAYADVASVVTDAVHAGDPNALVTTGGISWFDFDFLGAALGAGAATSADAVGVHPYRGNSPPETLPNHVVYARSLIRQKVGRDVPLWDTEWGYTTTQFGLADLADARQHQAVMAVREMLSARIVGFPLAIWYDVRDDGTDPQSAEHNFGLIANDGSDKPAILALRALKDAALGRTVAGVVDVAQPLFSGVRLDGTSDRMLVLWATSPNLDVTVAVPAPVAAMDMFGATLALATSYTLREATGPIYLAYDALIEDGGLDGSAGPSGTGGTSGTGGASTGGTTTGAGATDAGLAETPADAATNTGSRDARDESGCGCRTAARNTRYPAVLPLCFLLLARARRRSKRALPV